VPGFRVVPKGTAYAAQVAAERAGQTAGFFRADVLVNAALFGRRRSLAPRNP